jgi:hypothetical protein
MELESQGSAEESERSSESAPRLSRIDPLTLRLAEEGDDDEDDESGGTGDLSGSSSVWNEGGRGSSSGSGTGSVVSETKSGSDK